MLFAIHFNVAQSLSSLRNRKQITNSWGEVKNLRIVLIHKRGISRENKCYLSHQKHWLRWFCNVGQGLIRGKNYNYQIINPAMASATLLSKEITEFMNMHLFLQDSASLRPESTNHCTHHHWWSLLWTMKWKMLMSNIGPDTLNQLRNGAISSPPRSCLLDCCNLRCPSGICITWDFKKPEAAL